MTQIQKLDERELQSWPPIPSRAELCRLLEFNAANPMQRQDLIRRLHNSLPCTWPDCDYIGAAPEERR